MADYTRRVIYGYIPQGEDERITYSLDFSQITAQLGAPLSINATTIWDETDDVDVSATCFSAAATLVGDICSRQVDSLVRKHNYRMTFALNYPGGDIVSAYLNIHGERP